jgi:DNA-binding transcriptional regulator YhcF (GntR family)
MTERAQRIMEAFYLTFVDKRQDFIVQKLNNDGVASVLREVVEELKYIGITEKNILELANELEALK